MNWVIVGAIAIAALALLGVGATVLGTSSIAQVPGVAFGPAPVVSGELNLCTPGTFGCDKNPGP